VNTLIGPLLVRRAPRLLSLTGATARDPTTSFCTEACGGPVLRHVPTALDSDDSRDAQHFSSHVCFVWVWLTGKRGDRRRWVRLFTYF